LILSSLPARTASAHATNRVPGISRRSPPATIASIIDRGMPAAVATSSAVKTSGRALSSIGDAAEAGKTLALSERYGSFEIGDESRWRRQGAAC
jgi:hypothetical protein